MKCKFFGLICSFEFELLSDILCAMSHCPLLLFRHLINKSYKDKLQSRDQHIAYLDETLKKELDKNYSQVIHQSKQEKMLQLEVKDLHKRVESLVKRLGKDSDGDSVLSNRIIIPIQGGMDKLTVDPNLDQRPGKNKTTNRSRPSSGIREHTKRSSASESQSTLGTRPAREILVKSGEEKGDEITLPEFPIEEEIRGNVEKHIPAFLFAGGKPFDHQPTLFTNKKGRTIKSATLKDHRDEGQDTIRQNSLNLNETRQQLERLELSIKMDKSPSK